MGLVVFLILLGIVGSLVSALFHLSRDGGRTNRTLKALKIRIGLSLGLFALLFVLYWLGLISPNASPGG